MNKHKVWIINQYTSPEEFGYHSKYHFLSKELIKKYDIKIFSSSSSAHHNFKLKNLKSKNLFHFDGIDYVLFKNRFQKNTTLSKILSSVEFSLRIIFDFCYAFREKPKVILISVPNSIITFPAIFLFKLIGSKIIVEVRDIWPLAQIKLRNLSYFHPFYIIYKILELFFHRYSDYIISPIKDYGYYLSEYHIRTKNFQFIPQAVHIRDYHKKSEKHDSKLIGIYSGDINSFCAFEEFLESIKIINNKNIQCEFILIGGGEQLDFGREYISKNNLSNVKLLGKMSKKELYQILDNKNIDFAISLGPRIGTELYNKYGLSSLKLYDYMNYNLPVFFTALNNSDLNEDLGSFFCLGVTTEEISSHLEKFLTNIKEHKTKALKSRLFLKDNRSISVVASKIDKLFCELL